MFPGGAETSATTLGWAMAELIKQLRIMNRAQSEVREVFRRKGYESALSEMTYLKSVVKETLKLHLSASLLPRESKLLDQWLCIKTKVLANVWAIGRDPRC